MAGFFKRVAEAAADKPAAGAPVSTKNIALRVKGFDVENGTTTGVDMATGDELTIKLRALGKTFDKQGGVALWAKKGKYHVPQGEDGGVIVFESVVKDKDSGELTSRWGVVMSKGPEDKEGRPTQVENVLARPAVGYRDRNALDDKRAIEIIRPGEAQLATNEAELREAIASIIGRPFTSAVVRAFDGEELRASSVWRGKDKTIEQSIDDFRNNNSYLGRLLDDSGISQMQAVEVFPLERVYAGADTREMLRDDSKLDAQRFKRDWSLGEGKGWGFGESIVAIRTHDEGGKFFTAILPSVNRQPLWTLETVSSPHIKPQVAPALSQDSAASADAAPRADAAASPAPAAQAQAEAPSPAASAADAAASSDEALEKKLSAGFRARRG